MTTDNRAAPTEPTAEAGEGAQVGTNARVSIPRGIRAYVRRLALAYLSDSGLHESARQMLVAVGARDAADRAREGDA